MALAPFRTDASGQVASTQARLDRVRALSGCSFKSRLVVHRGLAHLSLSEQSDGKVVVGLCEARVGFSRPFGNEPIASSTRPFWSRPQPRLLWASAFSGWISSDLLEMRDCLIHPPHLKKTVAEIVVGICVIQAGFSKAFWK